MAQIAVNGLIYTYEEVGKGDKTPLLYLHGWGRNGHEWTEIAAKMSSWSGRKAYVLDLPGFGGSSMPRVKNIHEYAELVAAFCTYLELQKVIIVGHSLGGRVGIVLGTRYGGLVEKLILVDPAGVKPFSWQRPLLQIIAKIFAWIPPEMRRRFTATVMDEDYRNAPAHHGLYRAVVAEELRRHLPDIRCNVSLIWGERDAILPLSLSRVYTRRLKNYAFRVVWGAGHDPHLTHPDQFISILQEMTE